MKSTLLFAFSLFLFSVGCSTVHPDHAFRADQVPAAPDYALLDQWAAHPDKKDPADRVPCPYLKDEQAFAAADVFFIYPTTYTGSAKYQKEWNAPVSDQKTNAKTDSTAILFQASLFNGAGRVFAPRYRQAHYHSFFAEEEKASADKAIALAYSDVKAAFIYYLKHWNKGRPFIIAGHSQGGLHAMHLLKDVVEGTSLSRQLVVAYPVGYPVPNTFFKHLPPCTTPEQTGCFCTWRTYKRGYGLKKAHQPEVVCTNPLTWTTTEDAYAPANLNKGGVVRPFCAIYPALSDAQVHQGVVLSRKPKFPGSIFMRTHNYHIGDFNLYYMNVRENAQLRVKAYLKSTRLEKGPDK
jgi:hypothetical protein